MAQQFGSLFALWLVGFFILFPIRFTAQRALRTTIQTAPPQMHSPVLVELFTAEGITPLGGHRFLSATWRY